MKICLKCNSVEYDDNKGIDYIMCDDCRDANFGELNDDFIEKKASLVFQNGMKWDDVLNFFYLVILEKEDCIKIFKKFSIKKKVITEFYESWEGSNDGC